MNRSLVIAGLLALGTVAWIASGQFDREAGATAVQKPPAEVPAADAVTAVRVQDMSAQPRTRTVVLRGASEARRMIDLKVEVSGRIAAQLVPEGMLVETGTPLLQLATDDRAARLAEAEALLEQRRIEQQAAVRLAQNGHRSEIDVTAANAALQAAAAAVEAARIALQNTTLVAPYRGVVERHLMKEGAFADRGDAVLRLVELDPLVVVAHANETEVLLLKQGDKGKARLTDGRVLEGTIALVSRVGDSATRSFRVELHLPNPDESLPAGITADLVIEQPPLPAYKVSPAVLVLDGRGRLGVKAVDADDQVVFHPATILDDEPDGIWLGDLPGALRLIVVGQEFVAPGETVRPVPAESINGSGASGS